MHQIRIPLRLLFTLGLFVQVALSAAETEKSATPVLDPASALEGIPRDVLQDLRPGSRTMMEASGKASQVVAKNIEGKMATLKFEVFGLEPFQRPDSLSITRYRVKSLIDKVRVNGSSFNVYLMVIPDVSENEKVTKLKKGDKVSFSGKISNGEILKGQELHIDLIDATLVK